MGRGRADPAWSADYGPEGEVRWNATSSGIFFHESEPFTPMATSGRTTASQPYRFKGGQARRSPLLLFINGTTAVKSSAPHPAEPKLPSAQKWGQGANLDKITPFLIRGTTAVKSSAPNSVGLIRLGRPTLTLRLRCDGMRLLWEIFFRESEPFTPLATSGRTTAGQPYRFKGGQARRSPLLLSIHGTTAVKSSAPHPAEPKLPSARAKLRALRSAARSAAACGRWSSAPCGAELFLFSYTR